MAIFFDAPVAPDALTAFIREVPLPSTLGLTALFGEPRFLNTNTVDFAEIVRTNRTARYRSFDGRIHVSERDTGSEKRVRLAPLSSSLSMGEYERLQLEFARTSGTNQQALANAVYNDAQNLTSEVQNRLEQAWGDVLMDGKLTINENGFINEADYGVPASHIVTAGTVWTNPAALIYTDIRTWTDVYADGDADAAGFPPDSMLTSRTILRAVETNTELINAIRGSAAGASRVTIQEVNDFLSGQGLPTFRPSYDSRVDIDGTSTRVTAADKVAFLPPNVQDLGYTAMGVTATSLELVNSNESDMSFEEASGIVGVVVKEGPPFRQFTYVDAVGQPVLSNSKLLMVADVAA
jgi:hypothetical protein